MRDIAQTTHGELLKSAAVGDQPAWNALIDQFGQMVWSIARSFRLDEATAKDVSQTVWLRLVENLDRINDPERLPGWLATTCRREALRLVKLRDRTVPTDFDYDIEDESPPMEAMLIEDEEIRVVVAAFHTLGDDCRQLLRLLTVEPALSYEEISEVIDRPVGSLGPTRARCIERLKSAMRSINGSGGDSSDRGGER